MGTKHSSPAAERLATKDARISPCDQYRYTLERRWQTGVDLLPFLMLNPSTADASEDDPTIRRCMAFARREGFGGIRVLNLFAFRSPSPDVMKAAVDPVGPENDDALRQLFDYCQFGGVPVVAAWGVHGIHQERDRAVMTLAAEESVDLVCLGTTKDGHPRHPLYVKGDTPLTRYTGADA